MEKRFLIFCLLFSLTCSAQLPVVPMVIRTSSASTISEWANRVQTNGGARPSDASIIAANAFLVGLTNDGLDTKVFYANFIAPDSLTAALTPVIKQTNGQYFATTDPPANFNGFVSGDLTVNGLTGKTDETKFFKTGCSMSNYTASSGGCVAYIYKVASNAANADGFAMGVQWQTAVNRMSLISGTNFAQMSAYSFTEGAGQVTSSALATNGYYSNQRTGTTTWNLYYQNSLVAHNSLTNSTGISTPSITDHEMWVFCLNLVFPGPSAFGASDDTISFVAMTKGLSSADDALLFSRVQTLRQAFGGGYR